MEDLRILATIHACATRADAEAVQAQHGGTIAVERHGRRRVWIVNVPRAA